VFEARLALEEAAAELAPARLDEPHMAEVRSLVAAEGAGEVRDHRVFHRLVAEISGNPALEFFVDLLNRVTLLYLPRGSRLSDRTLAESAAAHAAIADAVLSGNDGLARRRMRRHLEAEADYLRARRPSRRRLADLTGPVGRSDKRAEAIARQIFGEIVAAGWPVGTLLGSEAELMARYDVSRAVLREAVRVLEHHQVARMRRGPGGGLFVAEPGIEAVTDAVALQVARQGIEPAQLFEVRSAVEMAVLDRVMATLSDEGADRLRTALDAEQAASSDPDEFAVVGHDLHNVLAEVAGNPVSQLLTMVLVLLTRLRVAPPAGAPDPFPTQDAIDVHRGIVEGILAGDHDLARHRMRRHLDALVAWVR
jgi:DNA-binding FadR family transcriptional regulator